MPLGSSLFDTLTITRYSGATRGATRKTARDIQGISSELKSVDVTQLAGTTKPRRNGALKLTHSLMPSQKGARNEDLLEKGKRYEEELSITTGL